jgi:hypothetical protein
VDDKHLKKKIQEKIEIWTEDKLEIRSAETGLVRPAGFEPAIFSSGG